MLDLDYIQPYADRLTLDDRTMLQAFQTMSYDHPTQRTWKRLCFHCWARSLTEKKRLAKLVRMLEEMGWIELYRSKTPKGKPMRRWKPLITKGDLDAFLSWLVSL